METEVVTYFNNVIVIRSDDEVKERLQPQTRKQLLGLTKALHVFVHLSRIHYKVHIMLIFPWRIFINWGRNI